MEKMEKKKQQLEMDFLKSLSWLPAIKTEVKEGGFLDWDYMVQLIENEKPFWEPGKETGYHMMTTGWLIGELIRRVSGKLLGDFLIRN